MDNKINSEYIDRAISGDLNSFEILVKYNTPFVMSVCLSYLKNQHDAEDACQETFLKLWHSIGRFRKDCSLTTFLYTVAKNTCMDILSKKSKNSTEELSEILADAAISPEEEYIEKEFKEAVFSAIGELDTDFSSVLLLREKAGLSYTEIAELLSISEGTVKSRINRARKKLLDILRKKNLF